MKATVIGYIGPVSGSLRNGAEVMQTQFGELRS